MRNASTIAAIATLLVSGLLHSPEPTEAAPGAATPTAPAPTITQAPAAALPPRAAHDAPRAPRFEIHTASPELADVARWSRDRYRDAGLELPPVGLYFHDDRADCGGNAGRARRGQDGHDLDLCATEPTIRTRWLVLHELAHAWLDVNLTIEQRQAFMDLRSVEEWNDHTADWWHRGTEHAADIIAWGLQETSRRPRLLPDNDLDSLTLAYEWLTGTPPLCNTSHEWSPNQDLTRPTPSQTRPAAPLRSPSFTDAQSDQLQP